MSQTDFHIIAEALLLYYEQGNSLFADQMISQKLGLPPEIIRSRITDWFHHPPEAVITYLENARIKQRILTTARVINNEARAWTPIQIQPMTEQEKEHGGRNLSIRSYFYDTVFGHVIMASTCHGICYLAFADHGNEPAAALLKSRFPNAVFEEAGDHFQRAALLAFDTVYREIPPIQLHVKGTPFQINTWKKLLEIPWGGIMSYSALAGGLKDSHALGAAVGSNPVALLIPCHRTVRASGEFGEYHWGKARKAALICMEAVTINSESQKTNRK